MSRWLLALHSSSETLGLAVCDAENPAGGTRILSRSMGRQLTNGLISAVEELLPRAEWASIGRLAVSTGPGGFTGTRLTVVMARTLAQQLGCPLHGESSFALMAPRLSVALSASQALEPFSIVQILPRRGRVAGRYRLLSGSILVQELEPPRLLSEDEDPSPALSMELDVASDVQHLLERCCHWEQEATPGPWEPVLPIYPTSPVGPV
jgi:tRNA threonylcarbamoyl adenosine modification protein YeaZ